MTEQEKKRNSTLFRIKDSITRCPSTDISVINGYFNATIHDLKLLRETEFLSQKEYDIELASVKEVYIDKALKCNGYGD